MKAVNAYAQDLIGLRTSRLYIDELFEELDAVSPLLTDAAKSDAEKKAALVNLELTFGKPVFILEDELKKRLFESENIPAPDGLDDILGIPYENCFLVAVEGDSMKNAAISDGDTLVCSKTSNPKSSDIIIAELNGQILIKRYMIIEHQVYLFPDNPLYKPRKITTKDKFIVLGKVIKIIKNTE
jgi:hypothetical protein